MLRGGGCTFDFGVLATPPAHFFIAGGFDAINAHMYGCAEIKMFLERNYVILPARSSPSSSRQCGSSQDMAALRTNLLVIGRKTVLSSSSSPWFRFFTFYIRQLQPYDHDFF